MTEEKRRWWRREILRIAGYHEAGWLPFRGSIGVARSLAKAGLLKECGQSVMPPHTMYVITDAGRAEITGSMP